MSDKLRNELQKNRIYLHTLPPIFEKYLFRINERFSINLPRLSRLIRLIEIEMK